MVAVTARENMWHFIMFRENIFHISLKRKYILLKKFYLLHFYWCCISSCAYLHDVIESWCQNVEVEYNTISVFNFRLYFSFTFENLWTFSYHIHFWQWMSIFPLKIFILWWYTVYSILPPNIEIILDIFSVKLSKYNSPLYFSNLLKNMQ
jgi:hypothetical protein